MQIGRQFPRRTFGARIVLQAKPGLTEEWLQRVVDCRIARAAALGHETPDLPHCPLATAGVTADVESTGDGFAIEVRAEDPETAAEIVRRAELLQR